VTDKNISVSVIIPTYNRVKLVTKAIDSVLAQTYKDYEIIVVDDGSTDDTGKLLAERYETRIRYIYKANSGCAAARNSGVNASRSELIALLDSDDIWLPKKLELQLPLMSNPDVVLSYTNSMFDTCSDKDYFSMIGLSFKQSPAILSDTLSLVARSGGPGIMASSIICRKSTLRRVGGFDERMRIFQDARTRCRLAMEGKFAVISEPLVIWGRSNSRDHLSKPSYSFFKESADAGAEIFCELYARAVHSPPDVQKRLRENLAYYLARQSQCFAVDSNFRMARRKAFESLVFAPRGRCMLRAIVGLVLPRAFRLLSKYKKETRRGKS
jgi:glycosyltransferase involved in cell wall biosynthesis